MLNYLLFGKTFLFLKKTPINIAFLDGKFGVKKLKILSDFQNMYKVVFLRLTVCELSKPLYLIKHDMINDELKSIPVDLIDEKWH